MNTLTIEINTPFPLDWHKEYYSIGCETKNVYAPCDVCDSTGKVTVKGKEYACPECKGNWRNKEIVGTTYKYFVEKYRLDTIAASSSSKAIAFNRCDSKSDGWNTRLEIRERDFDSMKSHGTYTIGPNRYQHKIISDDYKATLAEVKRLNKEQKEKAKE